MGVVSVGVVAVLLVAYYCSLAQGVFRVVQNLKLLHAILREQNFVRYEYFAGEKKYSNSKSMFQGSVQTPVFALKTSDNPHYEVIWADLNRKYQGSWGRPGDPNPLMRGVNHYNDKGDQPEGSNEGFRDGHVEWIKGITFIEKPKMMGNLYF